MSLQEIVEQVQAVYDTYKIPEEVIPQLEGEAVEDVQNKETWGYYHWLGALVRVLRPKQIVELGGAWGASALVMIAESPSTTIHSITLPEPPAFCCIKKEYPNLHKTIGDDLNLGIWPKGMELQATDVWFIDSLHVKQQLENELELYTSFFKKGALLLFDDIHINPDFYSVWLDLPYEKFDLSFLHVPSGFGMAVVS